MILAVLLTAVTVSVHFAQVEVDGAEPVEPTWWSVPLTVVATFPIAWRRSHTLSSTSVIVAAQVILSFAGVDSSGFIGVLVGLYSVGAHSSGPIRARVLLGIVLALGGLFVAGVIVDELDIPSFVSSSVILVTAFVVGDNLRRRRDAAIAMQERAERAERERELLAQQQVNAERSRIARELHDVVAHSVSVMVIQAAAARRSLHTSPDAAEQALNNIEDTGRQTMNELRGILGVLRRSDPASASGVDLDPQPGLPELSHLLHIGDGLPVEVSLSGDLDDLPPSVSLTGYRVVQEALTNVRRHAGEVTRVEVDVARHDDHVDICIVDDGRGAASGHTEPGFGIVGMSERVAAVGGTIKVGWRTGGGWQVIARLPLEPTRQVGAAAAPVTS
ncbi:MAG: sensor histidine kinase [Ilumatobacter sp.]|uniref:sensor histidine kinase n=1 Tax=Ilumatobacter sp. TaxID=1967498 RepID=UPI00391A014E